MVERIRELLQANQLTPTQFADSIGVARPIISHILSGRNKPSLEVVQKILTAFPELSLDWLLKGVGSMLADAPVAAPASPAQNVIAPVAPLTTPTEAPASPPPARKAMKAPRYRPQPAPVVPEAHQSAQNTPEVPFANPPHSVEPAASVTASGTTPAIETGNQSAMPAATVAAIAPEPIVPVPAVEPRLAETVSAQAAVAAPTQAADVSLASAFAEPGRVIRRIVIFYQDGTFTDYQPEPRLS